MKIKVIFTILITASLLNSADTVCRTFCSITRGYDIKNYSGTIYAGTDGGLIINSGGDNTVYDADDGLYKVNVSVIEKDFRNLLWLGHGDCSVTVYDTAKKKGIYLNDIEQAGVYTLNGIYSSGKYVYLATSGLLARYRYNDTYKKYEISELNSMTGSVSAVTVSGGMIYASFGNKLYRILETAQNINYLNNWTQISAGFSTGTAITGFAADGVKLYVLANNGMYLVSGDAVVKQVVLNNEYIYEGYFDAEYFNASVSQTGATVVKRAAKSLTGDPEIIFGTEEANTDDFTVMNNRVYFTSQTGYSYYDIAGDTEHQMSFNTPKFKGIKKSAIDNTNGNLVYLSGAKFSYMDMTGDAFYTKSFSTRGATTNLHSKGNGLYICTWGNGVNYFELQNEDYVYKKNYSFGGAAGVTARYPVHPGISEDGQGKIWITNWDDANDDSTLTVLSASGNVEKSFKLTNFTSGYDVYTDTFGGKSWIWLGSSKQSFGALDGIGIGIYDGTNLSIKVISMNEGIIDIVRDEDNKVWIATNNGIKYIDLDIAPSSPSAFSSANVNSVSSGPISNMIFDAEVNGINEKWFATDKGISVLSSDGNSWRHYVPKYYSGTTTAPGQIIKTNLPDYVINDIEFDEKNGIAIISSENGLSFLEYGKIFKSKKVKSGEIQTKPSPFINDGSAIMGFYFPEDETTYDTAKIFDIKGFLIRGGDGGKELDIQQGWDGRDNNGKIVSTGVYQVIAYSRNDRTKSITGKIAVVRK
ncbi:MAG TPA: hypothetical protein PLK90_09110 [Clostridiales bacterium]|nr:hypothetical protein [Clostridiales bacterium]HQP70544.1 hypothetical protein [Clostridiales bacterium]